MKPPVRPRSPLSVWVLSEGADDAALERLGDARQGADALGARVGVLVAEEREAAAIGLIAHGADWVGRLPPRTGIESWVATAAGVLADHRTRLVLASGDCGGRECAARLAVRLGWKLVSPALMVRVLGETLEVTGLDRDGRLARKVRVEPSEPVIVTLRPGVGEANRADPGRAGEIVDVGVVERPETLRQVRIIRADPATVDIRHATRLVAGGRGVGSGKGFETLRRFASRLRAGVAASRMAVDLGWVGYDRQVGQTGKTVAPELYVACGISGASHHLDGMSDARAIVAINTDPEAPIFKVAHLGLVADLHPVLSQAEERLARR